MSDFRREESGCIKENFCNNYCMLKNRENLLRKFLSISTIILVFCLGSACADKNIIPVTGIDPRALPLLNTMTMMAGTVEAIGQTATAYSFTPTSSPIPTATPNENEIKNLISNAIKDKLIATLGAEITVIDVKFGPVGAQVYTDLYIEINCVSDNSSVCPSNQVIVAVVDSCKEKKKKVIENVPSTIQKMAITIYNPGYSTIVIESKWSDVVDYFNDKLSADAFGRLIAYIQY